MELLRVCHIFVCIIFVQFGITLQLVAPPSAFQEHWHGHHDVVTRKYFNNDIAVYFDPSVSPNLYWPFSFLTVAWQHIKSVYGSFGYDKLYAVVHSDRLGLGVPVSYLNPERGRRNVLDVDLGTMSQWPLEVGPVLDLVVFQLARIVEDSSSGVLGNPAANISGIKFSEIFIYDVYKGLDRYEDATRWYNSKVIQYDSFPRIGTQWFKDWFFPIYQRHGGSSALYRFFRYLSMYFPKANSQYTRQLNWGEFVHFWSIAANKNLKYLATYAFGWSNQTETEFNKARTDFRVTYPA